MITQVCRYTRAFGCSLPWTPGTGFLALVLTAGLVFPVTATAGECPRIVSQSPYITHSLEYLGLTPCIVGASRYDDLDVEDTGGILDPDAQAIGRVEPDLAFTSSWVERDDWADTVPAGTRAIALGGFEGMDAVRENLERIADAAGLDDGAVRAAEFDDAWKEAADAVGASRERAVLMSSCSAQAYVYGPKTWLHDAFTRAGFDVVANQPGAHHLRLSEDTDELADLINQYDADVVFTFSGSDARSCRAVVASSPVRVVNLPSGYFSHPAPVILDGLAELQTRHTEWAAAQ